MSEPNPNLRKKPYSYRILENPPDKQKYLVEVRYQELTTQPSVMVASTSVLTRWGARAWAKGQIRLHKAKLAYEAKPHHQVEFGDFK